MSQLVFLEDGIDTVIRRKLARILKAYKGYDRLIRIIDLKTSPDILHRYITRVVSLPFYDNVGPSNVGLDVPGNSQIIYLASACTL